MTPGPSGPSVSFCILEPLSTECHRGDRARSLSWTCSAHVCYGLDSQPASHALPKETTLPSRGRRRWVPASPGKTDVLEGMLPLLPGSAESMQLQNQNFVSREENAVFPTGVAEGPFNILPRAPAPCVNACAVFGVGAVLTGVRRGSVTMAVFLRAGEGV